jgi:hypothetical protein
LVVVAGSAPALRLVVRRAMLLDISDHEIDALPEQAPLQ